MAPGERVVQPHGAWPSPITPELIVSAAVSLGEVWVEDPRADDSPVWWSELRPEEGGRIQLVRRAADGTIADVLPDGYAARTRAHEYGGGAWWLDGRTVYFANWDDQRLYRFAEDDTGPVALTRPPAVPHGLRYADGRITADRRWVICVRESHEAGGEAVNELVAIPTAGGETVALGTAGDFVANPRISPDGRWLAWLQWYHPDMPWDATELWVAELVEEEHDVDLLGAHRVAGGRGGDESVVQPEWSPTGVLHFISDRHEWWNVYAFSVVGQPDVGDDAVVVAELDAEVGVPPWVFGQSRYAFIDDGGATVVMAPTAGAADELRVVGPSPDDRTARVVQTGDVSSWAYLKRRGRGVVGVAGSFLREPAVVAVDVEAEQVEVLRPPRDLGLGPEWCSVPRHVTFPTGDGRDAHGLFYPPVNPDAAGPPGELPPLLVAIHGGPTGAARPQLALGTQFWTSRGFAVLDVNYRGSTGYGRTYRHLLDGQWGIADVEDCAAGAAFLASEGLVDGERLAIHGGSAGGFTTLVALIATDRFAAGTSSYGVTDLEALARDTHKFESRYLDRLVGPYPERRDLYVERSPIHRLDQLDDPVLILQGTEDEVVPLSQAEMMVEALRTNGVPFAYLAFEGEQHGFRQADTIRRALGAELAFYARILGFEVPAGIEPLEIENLP
jgi:dipeptidyl aminopeptidase/acylaminoacyl peptidase